MGSLPYMKFFPADWLSDCQVLSLSARGAWQTIICKAWAPSAKGSVTLKLCAWARLFGTSIEEAEAVIAEIAETGTAELSRSGEDVTVTCRRTVRDWGRAAEFHSERAESGRKGAAELWLRRRSAHGSAIKEPKASQKPEARIAEREQSREIPAWEQVREHANVAGLAEWKAQDWFNQMEANGWLDHQANPILKWKAAFARVKAKWEADGRPSGPPSHSSQPRKTGPPKQSKFAFKIPVYDDQDRMICNAQGQNLNPETGEIIP